MKNLVLSLDNLSVNLEDASIITSLSLAVAPGSVHALMGPNGSGKTTLASTLMGHPRYTVSAGTLLLDGQDITSMPMHKRAQAGIFLAFQQPCVIPGVSVVSFLKQAHQAVTGTALSVKDFTTLLMHNIELLQMDPAVIHRAVNEGFSGGEKKRLEMLQLLLFKPRLAILDEIDSGLDVDALRLVATGIAHARRENPEMALLIITHYQRILQYVTPDHVHIMHQGELVQSGTADLVHQIEAHGYAQYGLHNKEQRADI